MVTAQYLGTNITLSFKSGTQHIHQTQICPLQESFIILETFVRTRTFKFRQQWLPECSEAILFVIDKYTQVLCYRRILPVNSCEMCTYRQYKDTEKIGLRKGHGCTHLFVCCIEFNKKLKGGINNIFRTSWWTINFVHHNYYRVTKL